MFRDSPNFGAIASAFLSVQRGEIAKPAPTTPLPHHRVCPVCGFAQWGGASDHPWQGVRFAEKLCDGVMRVTVPSEADLRILLPPNSTDENP